MNKDNAKDYLPLVQALADGKTIQFLYSSGAWGCCEEINYARYSAERYRIKPESREIWVNIYGDGELQAHGSEQKAKNSYCDVDGVRVAVKFREVMDDE